MKKTIFAAALAAAVAVSGAAAAADLPRSPAPYYAPAQSGLYNWGGAYAGLNLGYEWGKVTNSAVEPSGVAGGGQIGYNWQSGQFVFGVETDVQFSGADDTFAPFKFSNPWFGTLRGRAGAAFNNVLLYGTLGLAYGSLKGEIPGLDETRTEVGWAGGHRRRIRLQPQLVGSGRVSLHGSRQPRLFDHRHRQRPARQHAAPRHQLSFLSGHHGRRGGKTPDLTVRGFSLLEPKFHIDLSRKYSFTTLGTLPSLDHGNNMAFPRHD